MAIRVVGRNNESFANRAPHADAFEWLAARGVTRLTIKRETQHCLLRDQCQLKLVGRNAGAPEKRLALNSSRNRKGRTPWRFICNAVAQMHDCVVELGCCAARDR